MRSVSRDLEIVNKRGLHARASARFVSLVAGFQSEITVAKDGVTVGGSSIMGLMMLAASPGCSIHVTATGSDAEMAMQAIADLVADRFGEEA